MEYLKQRQATRKRLYSKVTVVILVIVLILLLRPTWNIYQKSREGKKNLEKAKTELNTLNERKLELQGDLEYIKSDHGLDQEIRSKFGLTKENETMVVIIRDEVEVIVPPEPEPPNFFMRIWASIRGVF